MSTPSTIEAAAPGAGGVHAQRMDDMYRYTRHVYDLTRRYYLLGRDRMLRRMTVTPRGAVLEIGCGTARNLIKLQEMHPEARLFGLDASRSMLETAAENLRRRGMFERVTLRHALAEELDYGQTFGPGEGFDVIFFSYSLSMMPSWRGALDAAVENLRPDGKIYIVDFWDQSGLPRLFAAALRRWLAAFGVHFRPELVERLRELQGQGVCSLEICGLAGRYAYIAELKKKAGLCQKC
jgi:S-adenosylmethionine-diacylgycerolhomoserine-N-methlytransferase